MWPSAPKTQEEINQHISEQQIKMQEGTEIALVILNEENQAFLGYACLHQANTKTPELGIWLKKSAHGFHYGFETINLLKTWAETNLVYDYLKYPVVRHNIPSRKLAEKMGGIIQDEYIKTSESGKLLDEVEYRFYGVPMTNTQPMNITESLVRELIAQQFPQWSHLPIPIPAPLAMGKPSTLYPWKWSINHWLPGETAAVTPINDLPEFAHDLALFLKALQSINSIGGPLAGPQSFYRGGDLAVYDSETHKAIENLKDNIDFHSATQVWEKALSTSWQNPPVWVHGDVSVGNLLLSQGKLSAVIDFGQLAIGDPACDLAIAWTLFEGKSRSIFLETLELDSKTWERGRAWALWKSMMYLVNQQTEMNFEAKRALRTIHE
ncbi:GNAT family N-acetyltransferase, partial [Legionella pneumophila]|uniref:GNAT family N-acetyltransferase n=1 Tax=Legionella pneumophila TaxID=446 RepID=UPI000ABDD02B